MIILELSQIIINKNKSKLLEQFIKKVQVYNMYLQKVIIIQ